MCQLARVIDLNRAAIQLHALNRIGSRIRFSQKRRVQLLPQGKHKRRIRFVKLSNPNQQRPRWELPQQLRSRANLEMRQRRVSRRQYRHDKRLRHRPRMRPVANLKHRAQKCLRVKLAIERDSAKLNGWNQRRKTAEQKAARRIVAQNFRRIDAGEYDR